MCQKYALKEKKKELYVRLIISAQLFKWNNGNLGKRQSSCSPQKTSFVIIGKFVSTLIVKQFPFECKTCYLHKNLIKKFIAFRPRIR